MSRDHPRRQQLVGLQIAFRIAAASAVALVMATPDMAQAMSMKGRPGWRPTCIPLRRSKRAPQLREPSERDAERLAFEQAMEEYAEAGSWSRALQLLDLMESKSVSRTPHAWMSAATACAKSGCWAEALGLFQAMDKMRVLPDHAFYNTAIDACQEQGAYIEAAQLLAEMRQRGLPPNSDTYIKVISMLARGGELQKAKALYEEANIQGLFTVWTNRARFLDLQELPVEVAEVAIRLAVEERAQATLRGTAGKGGFYVLTGAANKRTAYKQQAVLRVMRDEYGLKVRVDPAKFGRMQVKGTELQRLGQEREMAAIYSAQASVL